MSAPAQYRLQRHNPAWGGFQDLPESSLTDEPAVRATEKEALAVLRGYLSRTSAGTKVQLVRPDGSTRKLVRRGERIITVQG